MAEQSRTCRATNPTPNYCSKNGGSPKIPFHRCSPCVEGLHEWPKQPDVGYKCSRHLQRPLATKPRSILDR